ncbi:MAG: YceD family protein [Putridiphycobacter sp.]
MKNNDYKIRFTSLKDGQHSFTFKVESEFFEQFENTDIKKANIQVDVELEKQSTMIIAQLNVFGQVTVMCDRCTDDVELEIKTSDELIYKFSEVDFEDEKVWSIKPNEIDIDLTQPIYEFISLAVPIKRVHEDGQCNQKMLKEINNYLLVESDDTIDETDLGDEKDEDIDPRWSALNKLKFKK